MADEEELEDTVPGVKTPELRMLRAEPHEVELRIELEPKTRGCAYAFCQRLFRGDSVVWEGPAEVNWMGEFRPSGFVPAEIKKGDPHRIWHVGDPVCLVVQNPTNDPLEVVIHVKGKAV